jgi:hypothetical protein
MSEVASTGVRDSEKFTDEDWKMAKKLGYDKYLERVRRDVLDEE